MSSLAKKIVAVLSVFVFAYVVAGFAMGRSTNEKENAYKAMTVYTEVLDHIQNDYVDQPNIHQVTSGALHGLLDSLDPQSSYMSPLEYKDYEEKTRTAAKASAGVALTKRFGYVSVISSLPDSPAAKANLRLGDVIEKIAGFTTSQMGVDQAQVLLSGDPGTVVKLSVIRRGKTEPEEVSLTLEPLPAPKVVTATMPGGVAYIRVPLFSDGMAQQIRASLEQFKRQGAKKLILDLRNCALGSDKEGIDTAQLFLTSGTIATLKGQTVPAQTFSAEPSSYVWNAPVAVLIGNGTAGPAELVAAAIADNHRGDSVGDRTYGTASEQKLIQLDDGSALILTIADYYTPSNKDIPVGGVTPTDVVRPAAADDVAQLNNIYPPAPTDSPTDPVVKKALQVLQGPATQKAA
ncbi:MAG TPA: S41 family peptidase [Candidatus Dormibacteraeota bacterium]|nr:S41 family peptidase [Candidatus Dormibacteraeota bacterium]